nr:DUF222 domain-containing protein [Nocardia otitidiscaviarum]
MLATAIDTLSAEDLTGFTDTEFAARVQGLEACRRRLEAVGHRHVIEINDRRLWTTTGSVGLYRYLVETLRLAKADAVARVKGAAQLGAMTSAYGESCEPRLPATAAAQAEGAISGDHARAVMRVMDRIPDAVDTEHRAIAEEHLADAARTGTPEMVGKVGGRILGYLDPDGTLTTAKDRARVRAATFGEQRVDGMSPFEGCFDPELRAMVDTVFAKWARPGMCMPDDPRQSPTGGARPRRVRPEPAGSRRRARWAYSRAAAARRVESVPVRQWPGAVGCASGVAGVDRADHVGHRPAARCGSRPRRVGDDDPRAEGVADGAGLDPAAAALRRNPRQAPVFGGRCEDRVAVAAVGGHRP